MMDEEDMLGYWPSEPEGIIEYEPPAARKKPVVYDIDDPDNIARPGAIL